MEPFGKTSAGLVMREYSQPILFAFSELIEAISSRCHDYNVKIPLPEDWKLSVVIDQLTLTIDRPAAHQFRLAYGYVSSLKVTDSVDTGSPFCAQVILRLPFRYGTGPDELGNSWLFCRCDAFASMACLPSPAQAVRVGMPVCGLLAKSSGKYKTAQLVGWPTCSAEDWELLSPDTFPRRGIELSLHDVYRLPILYFSGLLFSILKFLSVRLIRGIFARQLRRRRLISRLPSSRAAYR